MSLKSVRVENADNGARGVLVFVEGLGDDGRWHRLRPAIELTRPTEEYVGVVYTEQRLVIEAEPLTPASPAAPAPPTTSAP